MKIALVAPLAESVPPTLYGGTERVVSYLAEELVRLGHDVTLFASGDSRTAARLVACVPRALRLDPRAGDPIPYHMLMLERVRAMAAQFDVIHFHVEHLHLPLFRPFAGRTLSTLHGRLDMPGILALYRQFTDMPLVSISQSQRAPLAEANWVGTVYHGLPPDVCPCNPAPRGRYLAFLGRISPEKGVERAIAIANRAGMPLRIAAKVEAGPDERYWRERVAPLVDGKRIQYVGEIGEAEKPAFLGNAAALVFPVDWPEPFGLAMIEAMSCGTPVIAWPHGAVPEVVEPGLTGFIARSVEEAADAVPRAVRLDRTRVRERFEARFTAARMARDYLGIYRSLRVRKEIVA